MEERNMKKIYWVKKDPNGILEWIKMDGKQFFEFTQSPVSKGRYFIDFITYKIEVSSELYRKWKPEINHDRYLREFEKDVEFLSFDFPFGNDEMTGEEFFADQSADTPNEAIKNIDLQLLSEAIYSLTEEEQMLISELYLCDKPKTEQQIANLTGIPQQTINYRKNKILKKLKEFLVKTKKSQK
jgi:RNA polymerase sigma factor (sigma-70 family)